MNPVFIYPASFCPPTYGHLHLVQKAVDVFGKVTVISSVNPDKKDTWFSPETSKHLWSSYHLPQSVILQTLDEFIGTKPAISDLVMIRGIRDEKDADYEKGVMFYNQKNFGIEKYVYFFANEEYQAISSSSARYFAEQLDLANLSSQVSPLTVSALLEKVLGIKNLFLVVGGPGGGKSTFLKMLSQNQGTNIFINTDDFNHQLRPLVEREFRGQDLVKVALERSYELMNLIKKPWLALLKESLQGVPRNSNVFVEVPYGIQEEKAMFQFLGGKIIYIGCSKTEAKKRVKKRGTPKHLPFIDAIPNQSETKTIALKNLLSLIVVKTNGPMGKLEEKSQALQNYLNKEHDLCQTFLPGSCLVI